MKFVKTVDPIAFGNHKLWYFGLASLLVGAAAPVAGVLAVGAGVPFFCAGGVVGRALLRGGCGPFVEVVTPTLLVFQKDLMAT